MLTLLFGTSLALAQHGPDAHSLDVVPGGEHIATWRPQIQHAGYWEASGLFEYAEWSLIRWLEAQDNGLTNADDLEPVVDYLTTLNLGARYALHERAALALSAPLWVVPVFPDGQGSPGIGDTRLSAPLELLLRDEAHAGLAFSVVPHVDLPTGNASVSLGEGAARTGGVLAMSYDQEAFGVTVNIGADVGLGQDPSHGPRPIGAIAGRASITDAVVVGMELVTAPTDADNGGSSALPLEALASAQGPLRGGLAWRVGAGHSLSPGNVVPLYRVFGGLSLSPVPPEPPAPTPVVSDEGLVRVITRTITGEPVAAEVRFVGEPDLPPYELGEAGRGEYTLPVGEWRVLISAPSFGTTMQDIVLQPGESETYIIEVILQPGKVEIAEDEIVIKEKIHFAFDQAVIEDVSIPLLREVAATLLTHEWITDVEVQGHTDSMGEDDYNLDLSQRRVESVRSLLIEFGVDPGRLSAKGYGETMPIDSNETDGGRATNRRVQFMILNTSE